MSFSAEVKEELEKIMPQARHCRLAELSAIVEFGCHIEETNGEIRITIHSENHAVARKYFTLWKKTFNIGTDVAKALQALKFTGDNAGAGKGADPVLIKSSCCKRAYLRGAFLCIGSMSNPEKGYHLEFVCETDRQAQQIQEAIHSFDIEAKVVRRKKYDVVYLKEGAGIVDLLNVMGAHVSLMNLENVRILKEMRNSVNRKVNCETANINKTVNAAVKQMEDIKRIRDTIGFDNIPEPLAEIAQARLDYPEATLKELGTYLDPPVGKSGVNHRLRKLAAIAENLI